MGLLTGLATLPLAPLRGVIWLAERLDEAAQQELEGGSMTDQLAALEDEHRAGLLTDEELIEAQLALLENRDPGDREVFP